ncbi:MAG TPA: peptidase M4 family protein, partial [Saprospiraceae bacterium]|nr:peptidase M4 family protein [Saprospiraceae bacterium]
MNKITIILLCSFFSLNLFAQSKKDLKTSEQRYQVDQVQPIKARQNAIPNAQQNLFSSKSFQYQPITGFKTLHTKLTALKVVQESEFGIPLMINGRVENNALFRNQSPLAKSLNYLEQAKKLMQIKEPSQEFQLLNHFTDHLQTSHTKLQQYYKGVKVYNGEVILHSKNGAINLLNGRYYPTPNLENVTASLDAKAVEQLVIANINQNGKFRPFTESEKKLNNEKQIQTELVIYHEDMNPKKERLVWHVKAYASLITMNEYFVDAHTGEIISSFNGICKIDGHHHTKNHQHNDLRSPAKITKPKIINNITTNSLNNMPPPGGSAVQVTSEDLFGNTITLDVWDNNGVFHMIDASKAMYNSARSNLPDEGTGVIATLDASNKAPAAFGGYSAIDVTSTNNWTAVGVSAHSNSSIVFDYYKNTFGRNSIDGSGGNMFSIINVVDEDGEAMDNAFYSGGNMYYGNGNGAFSPLAKALDVAAHEISHGVINNTANLEYKFQSGAMNESFADVFGSLIDREDWLMGEDVVNSQFFPSGALRNLQDPNNGATRGSQNWQPKHMDEYVNLAANKDNGGVHINSGIPNRAYYLFATAVGKDKAEQVYYRALTTYLTRSSQFLDLRAAIIQSAKDIHGNNASEVSAAANAFAGVGLGDPSPGGGDTVGDYEEDVEINPGNDFIITTDKDFTSLYLYDF